VTPRLRVLFVDDEEELVSAVTERLELRGVEAVGCLSGRHALEILGSDRFDVVVLDVKMPGLGGLEVVRMINEQHPGMKVVLLTGHSSVDDAEAGLRLGAVAYLQKPVDLDALLTILRSAVGEG
jgi:DNA-binding NtrC family response regulator